MHLYITNTTPFSSTIAVSFEDMYLHATLREVTCASQTELILHHVGMRQHVAWNTCTATELWRSAYPTDDN